MFQNTWLVISREIFLEIYYTQLITYERVIFVSNISQQIHHDWHIIKRRIYLRTDSDKNYTNTDAKGLLNRQDKVPDLRRSWSIKTRPFQVRIRPGSSFSRSQKAFPRLFELTKPNVKRFLRTTHYYQVLSILI